MAQQPTLDDRVAALEKRQVRPKDLWDILGVIGGLLIPAAIAYAGNQYATRMAQAEIENENARAANSIAVAESGNRVSQASLVLEALDALSGDDVRRKRLAIQAILIALPDRGVALVEEVSRSDESTEVRSFAEDALGQRVAVLAEQLFSPVPAARKQAASELLAYKAQPQAVEVLVENARSRLEQPAGKERDNGLFNTLVVLEQFDAAALAAHRTEVKDLAGGAERIGPRTKAVATRVQVRLR